MGVSINSYWQSPWGVPIIISFLVKAKKSSVVSGQTLTIMCNQQPILIIILVALGQKNLNQKSYSHMFLVQLHRLKEWETRDANWSSCCCRFILLKLSCKSSYRLIVLQLSKWETPAFHWTWHTCQDLLKVVTTLTAIGLMFWNTRGSQC